MSTTGASPNNPWSFTARERRRDAERRRCLHGKAITRLWEELGFMYLRSMMCAVIRLLHLGGVANKVTAHTPAPIPLA